VLHAACWTYRTQKLRQNRDLCTIAQLCRAISLQLRHVSTIGKKLLNGNISSICPHNMLNFGPLTAEMFWWVCGTPANFNGFRVLASLLHRRRSTDVNHTLHDLWPSPALVYYIYIFGGSCPITEFCQLQNSLCVPSLLFSYIGSITAGHSSSGLHPQFSCFGLSCECFCVFLSNWTAILLHFDVGCASYCQDTGDL